MECSSQELDDLIAYVESKWEFDKRNYKRMNVLPLYEHPQFVRDHILKHLQKEVGKLAALLEKSDHTHEAPVEFRETILERERNLLILVLRLAAFERLSGEELVRAVRDLYTTKLSS